MKKNKGFTLIELIAVIAVLAIIALIIVPTITTMMKETRKNAFEDTAYGLIKAATQYHTKKDLLSDKASETVFEFPDKIEGLEVTGELPKSGIIKIDKDGKVTLVISNGRYCATKTATDTKVTVTEDVENCFIPVPITNMTITSSTEVSLIKGKTSTIELSFEPSSATNKNLKYTSSNKSVATISETGLITAIGGGTATITVTTTDGSNISRTINVTVSETYTNGIMQSVNNCINEGICSNGTLVKVAVNNKNSVSFNVINDDGKKVTLLMYSDFNPVAWVSKDDYNDDTNYGEWGNNNKGPITVLNYLNSQTAGWTNIDPIESYTYDNNLNGTTKTYGYQKLEIKDGVGKLTSQDGATITELEGISRARLLTLEEVTNLQTANNGTLPTYMYYDIFERQVDHWTLSASASDSEGAWVVGFRGELFQDVVYEYALDSVRPVITISK